MTWSSYAGHPNLGPLSPGYFTPTIDTAALVQALKPPTPSTSFLGALSCWWLGLFS